MQNIIIIVVEQYVYLMYQKNRCIDYIKGNTIKMNDVENRVTREKESRKQEVRVQETMKSQVEMNLKASDLLNNRQFRVNINNEKKQNKIVVSY